MQIKMDIKCLQILRATIYNEFVQIDPEEKERDPESYKKYVFYVCVYVSILITCNNNNNQNSVAEKEDNLHNEVQ